jgi:hypothetical protein
MPISLNALDTEVDSKAVKADFSVTTGASGQTALSYDSNTGVFSLTPVLGLTDLGISDGSAGQFLTTDGAGHFTFAPNGSPPLSAMSVTTGAATTPSSLTYDDVNGVFTYTPEDTTGFIGLTNLQVLTAANSGSGALSYNNTNGNFTYTPPDVSTYIALTNLSVTQNAAGTAGLSYDNTTGVFSYTPPDVSTYIALTNLSVSTGTAIPTSLLYDNTTGILTYSPPTITAASKNLSLGGATSSFTIAANHTVDSVLVFYNGVCLVPTTDYTVSGTTLTTTFTPIAGSDIVIRYLPI